MKREPEKYNKELFSQVGFSDYVLSTPLLPLVLRKPQKVEHKKVEHKKVEFHMKPY